jgi:ribulose-phosphate 3-epimerase
LSTVVDQPACEIPQRSALAGVRASGAAVLPSLLLCDFGNLEREIARLVQAGVRALHLDVMDGRFVPNLTYGFPIVEAVRRLTDLPVDCHLMIVEPEQYVEQFVTAGADHVTIHIEAAGDPRTALRQIRRAGATAGLAINPATPVNRIVPFLDDCDLVLVMSVMPGFGGQSFEPVALEKLRQLRSIVGTRHLLEVDGGVNERTIGDCGAAGADLMVVGSAVFHADDYAASIGRLERLAAQAAKQESG